MTNAPRWEDAVSAIEALRPARSNSADQRRAVCRAIMAVNDKQPGLDLYHSFSERHKDHLPDIANAEWLHELKSGRAGAVTLFKIAEADGWKKPRRREGAGKRKQGAAPRTEAPATKEAGKPPEAVEPPPASPRNYGPRTIQEPPKNLNAERTVLGATLIDNATIDIVVDLLRANHFYPTAHQEIFQAVAELHQENLPVDVVSVAEHLDRHGKLDDIGGAAYLAGFEQHVLTTQNIEHYCLLVRDAWQRRELIQASHEIIEDAHIKDLSNLELLELTEKRISSVVENSRGRNGALSIHNIEGLFAIELPENDNVVGNRAVRGDDLTVIAGPPGIGKSRMAFQLPIQMATGESWFGHLPIHQRGLKWLFFQTENGIRRLCSELGKQLKHIQGAARELISSNLLILAPITLDDRDLCLKNPDAVARMRAAVRKYDPDMVVFDPYIDFFAGESENDTTQTKATVSMMIRISNSSRPQTGTMIVHHSRIGKEATAGAVGWNAAAYVRGSKALTAAARSQINLAPGSADDSDLVVVAHGKCNDGKKFEPFAVRLDTDLMIYNVEPEFEMSDWADDVNGVRECNRGPSITTEQVKMVLRDMGGGGKRRELVEQIMVVTGRKQATAYTAVRMALKSGDLFEAAGRLCVAGDG